MIIEYPSSVLNQAKIVDLNRNYKLNSQPILALERDAIFNMIMNILQTEKGTYPFEPSFGCDLEKYVFRFGSQEVVSEIEGVVLSALNQWMPYARFGPSDVIAYKVSNTEIVIEVAVTTRNGRETFGFKISGGQ